MQNQLTTEDHINNYLSENPEILDQLVMQFWKELNDAEDSHPLKSIAKSMIEYVNKKEKTK